MVAFQSPPPVRQFSEKRQSRLRLVFRQSYSDPPGNTLKVDPSWNPAITLKRR